MTPFYDEDGITIYHGDCREVMDDFPQGHLVTDPPYGIASIWVGGRNTHGWSGAHDDARTTWDREAPTFVADLPALAEHSIIWGGNYFPLPPARGWLVWDKVVRKFSTGHCELAWTTLDQPVRAYNFANGQLATEGKFHPTQKPLGLMRWCLEFLPDDGLPIIDPFAGSGTTLRAAKDLGRRAVGVEVEERYCELAAQRLSQQVLDLSGGAA